MRVMIKLPIDLRQILLLTCLVFVGCLLSTLPAAAQTSAIDSGFNPQLWLKNALEWVASLGSIGALAFIGIYIIATVAFLPAFILTLGAGVLFGVWLGSVYVFIGATLGSIAAFLVGRYLARNWVAKKIAGNNKFQAIDRAVSKEGLKIVLLTRLSPIFPFNLLNYAFGVTGVSMRDYIIGAIGMIPGTIMFVYLGSLAGNLALIGTETQPTNPTLQWTIRIVGLLATIAVTVYVTKIAKQALNNLTVES
ncbi:TVP38/TMEM64 family protein [Chamaesiphon polymorphus CCALA 037]|uniref:TVP38/TMEM64 family membrane protein n=2 Tax=Chamaesiphon TaxID=217161 RepID=A0A2T1FYQ1_9CYAN|nr:TVP38/TMEM64 family protein [Chamaesiphon polymorphus CCALA 037]